MGQHSKPRLSRRQSLLIGLLAATALAVIVGAGVQAVVRLQDGGPSTTPQGGPAPEPTSSSSPAPEPPEPPSSGPTRAPREPQAESFPGRPEKRTGVRTESGLESGLGDDAGDLADEAQDLIDGPDERPEEKQEPLSFVVSSFNVLGAGHTASWGNKPQWPDWEQRISGQIRMLEANQVDVVGFQEFERPQFHGFMRRTGGKWGVYPALSLGPPHTRNSVAWRRDVWELADYASMPVPYFRGNVRPIPVILLTHKETGRQVFVINTHNPTSNQKRGNNRRWRAEATRRQIAKIRSLRAKAADVPVILTGDFNEREVAYCRLRNAGMKAANPGGDRPGCSPPALMGIDWIFGTPDVAFSDYRRLDTGRVSDHPMIVATARVE